jgi:hypothetical protein
MTKTPNINLNLPNFNVSPWHDLVSDNFRAIDATINSLFGLTNLLGAYQNSTAVTIGQRYFDTATGFYYEALSAFTTMATPSTFADERTTYPLRWKVLDAAEALDAASAAAADAVQTALDRIATNADAVQTALDKIATNADATQTALDVITTNADVAQTNADAVQTALDRIATALDKTATNADVVITNADVVLTNADVVLTHADAILTNADAILTNADAIATAADVLVTNADAATTTSDVVLTHADVVLTHADVVLTAADVVSSAASAAAALVSENAAAASLAGAATLLDVRRNRITNPCMQISKENGNTAGATSNYYIADEWTVFFATSTGVLSAQRVQIPTAMGALDRCRLSVGTVDTSLAAGEYFGLLTKFEGSKMADLLWGTSSAKDLVLRFEGKMPDQVFCVVVRNADGTRSFVREVTPSAANTDEIFTITIPGETTGTWPTGDVLWGDLLFTFAAGSTFQTTADAWAAGNYLGTAGMANGLAALNTFEIGDVGLKLDPDSTGVYGQFEVPDPAQEMLRCMRYYETGRACWSGYTTNSYSFFHRAQFCVPKRVAPTITLTNAGSAYFPATSVATDISVFGAQINRMANGNDPRGYFFDDWVANARI